MRFRFLVATLTAIFLSVPAPLLAQSSTNKKVRVGKTVYDFNEVDILGNLRAPEGQSIVEAPEFQFQRLLDLDESFLPDIISAVDEF